MSAVAPATEPVVLTRFAEAKEVYRSKDLRQALYDEGEVIMADVLINLHGAEHRARRRVENRAFRRETFERYERELFPRVIDETLAPVLEAGRVDLVRLSHELMLHLAALTAGVDRPLRTAEETRHLYTYMMMFIEGATLAHSTKDKEEQRRRICAGLADWDREFLQPSMARRRVLLDRAAAGEEVDLPHDVLTKLLENREVLGLSDEALRREVAFFLLAGAHTTATAFVRSIDHILGWLDTYPEDAQVIADNRFFVQRCVHETLRLNPSSPIGRRRALAPVSFQSGIKIPEGSLIVLDLQQINRDPSVFGDDAGKFNPRRLLPPGVAPFGLSFAAGMHVCIGQDLAVGTVPDGDSGSEDQLLGLLSASVQRFLSAGVRRDPADPPEHDQNTVRPYWGRYPVLLGDGNERKDI
jgi:cytochrome P450